MPEISQDIFESVYPIIPPITPDVLRARANSASKKKVPSGGFSSKYGFGDNSVVTGGESTSALLMKRNDQSENDLESFLGSMDTFDHQSTDSREISHR